MVHQAGHGLRLVTLTLHTSAPLPLDNDPEELGNVLESNLLHIRDAEKVEEGLRVHKLLRHDRVGLAKGADPHGPGVDLHRVQEAAYLDLAVLSAPIESELAHVEADQLDLSFEVIPEPDDLGPTFVCPSICNLLELVRVESPVVQLDGDVTMDGAAEIELELAVQEALLAGVE